MWIERRRRSSPAHCPTSSRTICARAALRSRRLDQIRMTPSIRRCLAELLVARFSKTFIEGYQSMTSRSMRMIHLAIVLALPFATAVGQGSASGKPAQKPDTSFAALQDRGKKAMGVDQYTSTHKFDATPTGGRIELQRDTADANGVAQIRAHMREIA